jgi:hypothetical protein
MTMKRIIPGKHIRCFWLSMILLIIGGLTLHAIPETRRGLKYDREPIVERKIAPDKQEEYNEDETWKYDRDKKETKSEPTVFDRMWNGFWDKVKDSFQGGNHESSFNPWTILWILILVAIIVLVILKLTNTGVSTLFSGRSRTAETADATLEDVDIHAIDYERQISEALAKGDYRLGVRLWFLRTLKTFSDKELVHWKIDKTNSDYYYELSDTVYQKEFGEVSNVYDYIWYGEFPVDENSYTKAEDKFRTLYKKIEKK